MHSSFLVQRVLHMMLLIKEGALFLRGSCSLHAQVLSQCIYLPHELCHVQIVSTLARQRRHELRQKLLHQGCSCLHRRLCCRRCNWRNTYVLTCTSRQYPIKAEKGMSEKSPMREVRSLCTVIALSKHRPGLHPLRAGYGYKSGISDEGGLV